MKEPWKIPFKGSCFYPQTHCAFFYFAGVTWFTQTATILLFFYQSFCVENAWSLTADYTRMLVLDRRRKLDNKITNRPFLLGEEG
jgi:hypothetical protein